MSKYVLDYNNGTVNGEAVERLIYNKLAADDLTLSVAESLTGGIVAAKLIDVAGISKYFREGIVAYANEAKESRLNVKADTLRKYGAVSQQTATEMAQGLIAEGADVGISTTGIAGPGGGSAEKPVGTVWFGFATKTETYAKKQVFDGNRTEIRNKSANYALINLFLILDAR